MPRPAGARPEQHGAAPAVQPPWVQRASHACTRSRPRPAGQAIGGAILADLQRQREQIQAARQAAQQTDASVAQGEGTLKRMGQWWRLWG